MKRITALLFGALIALAVFIPTTAFAADFPSSKMAHAKSVLLIDANSGKVLASKKPDIKVYPASTTKLMTLLLCLEKGDLDQKATVGKEITKFHSGSSKMDLTQGEKVSREDLIYGMMLISGNDAAATLAVSYGGSIEKFAKMMNDKAEELGMKKTKFTCPEGVHDPEHYTTASDMAKLVQAGLKNEQWKQITGTKQYDLPKIKAKPARTIYNGNMLINPEEKNQKYNYEYAKGGKTGSTDNAGNCLVAYAEKDGMQLIVLIYGDDTVKGKSRWPLAKDLFDYGFDNYKTIDLKDKVSNLNVTKEIANASEDDENNGQMEFGPSLDNSFIQTFSKEEAAAIESNPASITSEPKFDLQDISAPIKKGDQYGTITYKGADGKVLFERPLLALRDMAAQGGQPVDNPVESESPGPSATSPLKTQKAANLPPTAQISPWWWMLLPVILIAVIVIRVLTMNRKRRSKFKNKRKVYNYRIR